MNQVSEPAVRFRMLTTLACRVATDREKTEQDRLEKTEQGLRVIDYKTGTSVPTIDEAAQSIQLAFYARAVQEDLGPVVAAEMWFPRYNSVSVTTTTSCMRSPRSVRNAASACPNSRRRWASWPWTPPSPA